MPDTIRPDPIRYNELREQMVIDQLEAGGIRDSRVLQAMRQIPREAFVPQELRAEAYFDGALPIDCEQTISQPLIVAMMSEALELDGSRRVLEIGTGSGYQAAVLSQLAADVISIERHAALADVASARLTRLGCENVTVFVGDGTLGCPERASFDRITVTAAADCVPPALLEQLVDGGRLIIPLGDPSVQTLTLVCKIDGQIVERNLTSCRFVPLVEGEA